MNSLYLSLFWWNKWREHVAKAHQKPEYEWAYGRAAMIAQGQYMIWAALESKGEIEWRHL